MGRWKELFFVYCLFHTSNLSAALSFDAFPRLLNGSGDAITLHWAGLTSPSHLDWIGLYTPPNSDDHHYIGYVRLSAWPDWAQGAGTLHLPLLNMRDGYEFRLFREEAMDISDQTPMDDDHNPLPSTAQRLAASDTVHFMNYNEPTQIHLSLTSVSSQMRVMFVTRDPLPCLVKYGSDVSNLHRIAQTSSVTYSQSDMCDAPANSSRGWRSPGYIHDGLMEHLAPAQRYFYQVGSDEGGWSRVFSFTSANPSSDETDAFLFGDMGVSVPYTTFLWMQAESKSTVKWLIRDLEELGDKPTFISHIGDISYARGYAWLWDAFFSQIEPVATQVPYHVCIGNHEYDWPSQPWKPSWAKDVYRTDGGGECGVPYSIRFHMPGNSSFPTGKGILATQNLYYSLNFGVVHFTYFSTETDFLPGSDQYNFLVQDLQTVDRHKTPFIVVLGHRPMYTSADRIKDAPVSWRMREHLEPLLLEYKVDLVLWGHVHKYERTCPIKNFSCVDTDSGEKFPVHVIVGMGGQDSQPRWKPRLEHPDDPIFPQPKWSAFRGDEFGYTRLHASRETLTLFYIGNHDGEVHDVLTIQSLGSTSLLSSSCSFSRWFGGSSGSCNSRHQWWLYMFYLISVFVLGVVLGISMVLCFKSLKQNLKGNWILVNANETELAKNMIHI